MNLLMLFIGMFIDLPAAVLLLTPVFVPLAQSIGMDMTQLGIMMVVNLALGLYTPPVGTTLFITDPTDLDTVSKALPAQGFKVQRVEFPAASPP
ncbi:TRAP transporter large permease subunit, partial [Acinetobacter baumannii]|nr:TRAP transporter large permease subunit [Acinetobacter baumannii]MCW1766454.1 TRAP transporter large permease subunit [Acinetobacter baumannii]